MTSGTRYAWTDVVIRLGLEHRFLLNAVLSVSALHLAKIQSDQDWLVESTSQMEAGLNEFHSLISDPDERLGPPLYAFSCLMAVLNFGVAKVQKVADRIQVFLNCIRLVREVSTITFKKVGSSARLGICSAYGRCVLREEQATDPQLDNAEAQNPTLEVQPERGGRTTIKHID